MRLPVDFLTTSATKLTRFIGAVSLLFAAPALAFDEPDSFRGVPWGASMEEMKAAIERSTEVRDGRRSIDRPRCYGSDCYAVGFIGPVRSTIIFSFRERQFVKASLSFKSDRYTDLRTIFIEKYGPPTSQKEEPYRTKGGAESVNETLMWSGDKVIVVLSRYGQKITEGSGFIALKEEVERSAAERAGAIKKGKGDL